MIKSAPLALATLLVLAAGPTFAAPADDACGALMDARGHLVTMLGSSDKAANDGLKGKIHEASAKVDATVAAMLRSYNANDEAKANAFKPAWEAFKQTREEGIIPAIYAGKVADAKALATGIQAERMKQMKAAMGCK